MTTHRPHIAFCDGGLANRLNSLLFALVLRRKFGGNWGISWPRTNWCGASFDRLFRIDAPVDEQPQEYYKLHEHNYLKVIHENQVGFQNSDLVFHAQLSSFDAYKALLARQKPLFYFHHLLPSFTTLSDLGQALTTLSVSPDIALQVRNYCHSENIDSSVIGIHIRKTDFGNLVNDNELFNLVSSNNNRFFICSDSPDVTNRFANLPNCTAFEKTSYPEKADSNKNWNSISVDVNGNRRLEFNVKRSEESVAQGLVDMLVLSRTTIVDTSPSTFLRMAMIFKAINFFQP